MDKATRPDPTDYGPYVEIAAFDEGITDYMRGRHDNPYHDAESLDARAWDRGSEYAMRVCRWHGT